MFVSKRKYASMRRRALVAETTLGVVVVLLLGIVAWSMTAPEGLTIGPANTVLSRGAEASK